jgi:hypothetical protein
MNSEIITREKGNLQAERLIIIENRIRDNMNRVAESALDIGRCLNQAKAEELVPHGQWQEWVHKHTGMSPRAAQYVMKAAREIAPTSAIAMLDFSKVQALLTLPPEDREQFAQEVDAENKSVRELKEAIKARQKAEQEAADAKKRAEQLQADYDCHKDHAKQEREILRKQINGLNAELEAAQAGGAAQAKIESLKEELEELEDEVARRAAAEADAKRELLALRTQVARGFVGGMGGEGLTPDDLGEAIHTFMGQAERLLYMRTQIAGADHNTRAEYRDRVSRVVEWCERAMRLLDTVDSEVIEA